MIDRAMTNQARFRDFLRQHPDDGERLVASRQGGRDAFAAAFNRLWWRAQWVAGELEALPTPPTRH